MISKFLIYCKWIWAVEPTSSSLSHVWFFSSKLALHQQIAQKEILCIIYKYSFTLQSSGSPPSTFRLPYDSFKEKLDLAAPDDCHNKDGMQGSQLDDLDYDFLCFFLSSPRLDLYRSIDLRCEDMLSGKYLLVVLLILFVIKTRNNKFSHNLLAWEHPLKPLSPLPNQRNENKKNWRLRAQYTLGCSGISPSF